MSRPAPALPRRPAGRCRCQGEIVAEYQRATPADLGATLQVRWAGEVARWTGPDLPRQQVGAELDAEGYWDVNRLGEEVFRVEVLHSVSRPRHERAVVRYLVANIPRLGPKGAGALVRVLGPGILDKLIEDPTHARGIIPGAKGEAVTLALHRWAGEQKLDSAARILTTRLTDAGVSYGIVRRIIRYFSSAEAAAVVALRHPYRLIEVPGIGWATADDIAQRLGVLADDPARYLAACQAVLREGVRGGSSGVRRDRLLRRAARLLGGLALDTDALLAAVDRLVEAGHAVQVRGLLGDPAHVAIEAEIADLVAGIEAVVAPLDDSGLETVERVLANTHLSDEQREAVRTALDGGVRMITGRPGAGKTTTLKAVVACARALGWRVQIVAPTGKAASRAAAVTRVPASTVHRLLSGAPMDAPKPVAADLIVVDEASMCDMDVAAWLLRAVAPGARVLWCGDADQLPSVGPGQVLADLIKSGVVPSTCLTRIYRQADRSPIIRNARLLLDGKPLDLTEQVGWRFVPAGQRLSEAPDKVLTEVRLLLQDGLSPKDVQVLAPVRRGPLGVESLNLRLQDLLNPSGAVGPWVGGGVRARIGDRVITTRNIYDLEEPLFNGEQGIVVEANPNGSLTVDLGDRSVSLRGIYCFMLRLAWAVTVHRSQGSEYPGVVLAYDHRAHGPMLDRRLLYTAITRAQRHCSIVGTRNALARSQSQTMVRETTLAHHLAELLPHVGRPHRGGAH